MNKLKNKAKLLYYLQKNGNRFFDHDNLNYFNKLVIKTLSDFDLDSNENVCALYLSASSLSLREMNKKFPIEIVKLAHLIRRGKFLNSLKYKTDKLSKRLLEILVVKQISMIEYAVKTQEERVFKALIKTYPKFEELKINGHMKEAWDVLEFYCKETNYYELVSNYKEYLV